MINHVRTLILNECAGKEFVPAEFVPMPDTPAAKCIRERLFTGLSPEQKDGRMHQIMQLLHTPELEGYVLEPDPRITYLPFEAATDPGSLVDVAERLHATITTDDEEVLFDGKPELRAMWNSDKMLFDLAGIVLALAHHTDRNR